MSKQTPLQRNQSAQLITLYRNLLVSYSDTLNIESLEFPFHTQQGRAEGTESYTEGRAGKRHRKREGKVKERWD